MCVFATELYCVCSLMHTHSHIIHSHFLSLYLSHTVLNIISLTTNTHSLTHSLTHSHTPTYRGGGAACTSSESDVADVGRHSRPGATVVHHMSRVLPNTD